MGEGEYVFTWEGNGDEISVPPMVSILRAWLETMAMEQSLQPKTCPAEHIWKERDT